MDWDWGRGYREWSPPAALRPSVSCVWARTTAAGSSAVLVLPDACVDLIWARGRGVFVAGPDTGPTPDTLPPGTVIAGVRFAPGAGGPALGLPLSALLNQRVDVADLGRGPAARLAPLLPGSLPPDAALRLLVDAAGALVTDRPADRLAAGAARLLGGSRARVDDVAARLDVSERQLRRRCEAAVGYGPATLRRVLRFRRFVSLLDAGEVAVGGGLGQRGMAMGDLAQIAADTGYADQAHLTRETVRLAGLTPVALASARRPAPAPG